jgi:hypothetical protein
MRLISIFPIIRILSHIQVLVAAPGVDWVGSAHPENFLKHVKNFLVSGLKLELGGLSPPGREFLAPPLPGIPHYSATQKL